MEASGLRFVQGTQVTHRVSDNRRKHSQVAGKSEDLFSCSPLGKLTGRKSRAIRPRLGSARRRARHFSRASRHRLREFPGLPPNPTLHIANRPNEVILQFHFGPAPIARPPQAMTPHQLALRAFNPVALFHLLLEALGLLLLPPGLQDRVVLAHHQRPVGDCDDRQPKWHDESAQAAPATKPGGPWGASDRNGYRHQPRIRPARRQEPRLRHQARRSDWLQVFGLYGFAKAARRRRCQPKSRRISRTSNCFARLTTVSERCRESERASHTRSSPNFGSRRWWRTRITRMPSRSSRYTK